MKFFYYCFVIFCFIQNILSLCGKGCLSCVQNQCLLCNNKRHYYLNYTTATCELVYINHCARSINGHCVECEQDFILQNQQNQSVSCKPVKKKIENCQIYKSPKLCQKCKVNYYLYQDGLSCVKYSIKIEKCLQYEIDDNNTTHCQICENGYILSKDKQQCTKYEEDSNCLIASNFYCAECQIGYIPKNVLFNDFPNHKQDVSFFYDIFAVEHEPYRQSSLIKCVNSQPNCQDYQMEIIQQIQTSENNLEKKIQKQQKQIIVCKQCKKGYYLTQVNQNKYICSETKKILNCEIYLNQDVCSKCKTGYFLNDENICQQVTKQILNCKYYKSANKCQQCFKQYYMLEDSNTEESFIFKQFFELLSFMNKQQQNIHDFVYISKRNQLEKLYNSSIIQQLNFHLDLNILFGPVNVMENQNKKRILELSITNQQDKLNKQSQKNTKKYSNIKNFQNEQLKSLENISFYDRKLAQQMDNHIKIHQQYLYQKKYLQQILFTLDLDQLQCFRKNVDNCADYKKGKCIYCDKNYYLLNNECKEIEKQIFKCQIYYSENNCAQCENGYILYENICYRMNPIFNCKKKIFTERGKCLLCKSGFYYNIDQDKCVENKDIQEKKCLIFQSLQNKNCYLCDQDHFMGNDNKCYLEDIPLTGTIIGHHQKLKDLI